MKPICDFLRTQTATILKISGDDCWLTNLIIFARVVSVQNFVVLDLKLWPESCLQKPLLPIIHLLFCNFFYKTLLKFILQIIKSYGMVTCFMKKSLTACYNFISWKIITLGIENCKKPLEFCLKTVSHALSPKTCNRNWWEKTQKTLMKEKDYIRLFVCLFTYFSERFLYLTLTNLTKKLTLLYIEKNN